MNSISFFVWQLLPFNFFLTLLFASDTLAKPVVASTYVEHCGSIAPESSPTKLLFGASNSFLISNGLFSAGSHINNHLFLSSRTNISNSDAQFHGFFHFQPGQVHRTHHDGTLQLEATLVLIASQGRSNRSTRRRHYEFGNHIKVFIKFSGFWSEAKGKLCMVSTGEIQASKHNQVTFPLSVVLKLEYPKVSNITTSIIKGSIESLNVDMGAPTHFESISLLAYAQRNYEYTMLEQADEACSHLPPEESVGSDSASICSNLATVMQKETFTSSDLIDYLEFRFLSVDELVCSKDGTVHLSMLLSNDSKPSRSFNSKSTLLGKLLVAEGAWDHHNSKLCLIACCLIGKENNSSVVEDCSLSLTFWFPVTFSLKQRSTIAGRMWNTSRVNNNNANKIASLYSVESYRSFVIPGMKYVYTELDRAKKNCQIKDLQPKKIERYPNTQSQTDMTFQLSIKNLTNGKIAWGNAKQISIGDTYLGREYRGLIYEDNMSISGGTGIQSNSSFADQDHEVSDVGYTISYTFWERSTNYTDNSVDISAEGIYNSTTGTLCLVGCRKLGFNHNHNGKILNNNDKMNDTNWDCTFFIQVQLPPLDSKQFEGTGKISSLRDNSDPLYFKPLEVTVSSIYLSYSVQEYGRIDAEMILVIISRTVLCICSYLQVHHVRKYSTIRPLMSITMLVVLTVGCMVTLILNTEAMLAPALRQQDFFLQSGGWISTTNTIARLLTIVAVIINYRLFQLAWGSRSKEESGGNNSCNAEKKALMFCVPLYIVGALVSWYVHSTFYKFHRTTMEELANYVGLLVDNFLLPQIIFNMFSQSKEKVLNPFFYFGVTLVRIVPHIYNAYRAWRYREVFSGASYMYANHDDDYYSTLLDLFIPFEGLLFVLLVYLQQRFGGRCFLPKRFKGGVSYEPVYDSNI